MMQEPAYKIIESVWTATRKRNNNELVEPNKEKRMKRTTEII